MSDENEDIAEQTFTVTGTRRQLRTLEFLLKYVAYCGEVGTTQFVDLMIDGDGGARLEARANGCPLKLTEEERAYLEGQRERLPPPDDALAIEPRDGRLGIDLV